MPSASDSRRLHLSVPRRDVDLEAFMGAVRDLLDVVSEVGNALVGSHFHQVRWKITALQGGSALLEAEPLAAPDVDDLDVDHVLAASQRGLDELAREARRPPYFSDKALQKSRALSNRFSLDEGAGLRIGLGSQAWTVARSVASHVEQITRGRTKSIGSLDGKLVRLEEGRGVEFCIMEAISGRRVECFIPESLVEKALSGFRHRVNVFGVITETSERLPRSIEVESIEVLPDDSQLPQASDVRGILGIE